MKLILTFMLGLITVHGVGPAQTASKRRLVANLKNNAIADGCGCYFQFRGTPQNSERYIFFSTIEDDSKTAWMNIAGRDVKLKLERQVGPLGKESERVGSRSTLRYRLGDVTVSGTYIVTGVCDPNDESCESTQYSATFTVRKGGRSEVVKAVGSCGC